MGKFAVLLALCILLMGCGEQQGKWEARMPGALDQIIWWSDPESGNRLGFDERVREMSGSRFYPYLEDVGGAIRLRIYFYDFYKDLDDRLAIDYYRVTAGDQLFTVTPNREAGEEVKTDIPEGGYVDYFDRVATDGDIGMLALMALAPEIKIETIGVYGQTKRVLSHQERLIILTILSAHEQMIQKKQ